MITEKDIRIDKLYKQYKDDIDRAINDMMVNFKDDLDINPPDTLVLLDAGLDKFRRGSIST